MAPDSPLPADVLAALEKGDKIEAIKRLRTATGLGLKEAKDVVERYPGSNHPVRPSVASMLSLPFAVAEAMKQGNKLEAIRLMREQGGLGLKEAKDAVEAFERANATGMGTRAPGEVPRSRAGWWLMAVLLLAALGLLARHLFASPG
ncbi:MAG: ribosomal protein L7/L12 [Burkholderiales bacterium]|nr:ribosomal protein L7/L12 [Burkholderiales bacterium]